MIVRHKSQRVAVLVDVQNLYYSARYQHKAKINFKNLLKLALADRILIRALAYVIRAESKGEKEFFEAVHSAGFEVREKELQTWPGGGKKGDWDIGIAMDAVRMAPKVDSIVLISGDGDFIPLVNYLQQSYGVIVEVIAFGKSCSGQLKGVADDFIDMDQHKGKLLLRRITRPFQKNNQRDLSREKEKQLKK